MTHAVESWAQGQAGLGGIKPIGYEARQGCDIPAIRIAVTAHRADLTICPTGGAQTQGTWPCGVTQAVQDGPAVKTWAAYCSNHPPLPVARTAQLFDDLVHQPLCDATVLKASGDCGEDLTPSSEAVQERRRDAEVVHRDESGLRVMGTLPWLSVASTERLTSSEGPAKRGHEAMDEAGRVGACTGIAVHAHWKPSCHSDECAHALGTAHHVRARHGMATPSQPSWSTDMSALLLESTAPVEARPAPALRVSPAPLAACARRYDAVV